MTSFTSFSYSLSRILCFVTVGLVFFHTTSHLSIGQTVDSIPSESSALQKCYFLILGKSKFYNKVYRQAQSISLASQTPFSLRNHIYDRKKGLILPENDPDEVYAGAYLERIFHTDWNDNPYISIEKSDAYPNLIQGYYIIVAGIYSDVASAEKDLKRYLSLAPQATIQQTEVYLGCRH